MLMHVFIISHPSSSVHHPPSSPIIPQVLVGWDFQRDILFYLGAVVLAFGCMVDGRLCLWEALAMFVYYLIYLGVTVRTSRTQVPLEAPHPVATIHHEIPRRPSLPPLGRDVGWFDHLTCSAGGGCVGMCGFVHGVDINTRVMIHQCLRILSMSVRNNHLSHTQPPPHRRRELPWGCAGPPSPPPILSLWGTPNPHPTLTTLQRHHPIHPTLPSRHPAIDPLQQADECTQSSSCGKTRRPAAHKSDSRVATRCHLATAHAANRPGQSLPTMVCRAVAVYRTIAVDVVLGVGDAPMARGVEWGVVGGVGVGMYMECLPCRWTIVWTLGGMGSCGDESLWSL